MSPRIRRNKKEKKRRKKAREEKRKRKGEIIGKHIVAEAYPTRDGPKTCVAGSFHFLECRHTCSRTNCSRRGVICTRDRWEEDLEDKKRNLGRVKAHAAAAASGWSGETRRARVSCCSAHVATPNPTTSSLNELMWRYSSLVTGLSPRGFLISRRVTRNVQRLLEFLRE